MKLENIFKFSYIWLVKMFGNIFFRKTSSLKMMMTSLIKIEKTSSISNIPNLLSAPHLPNPNTQPLTIPPPCQLGTPTPYPIPPP